MIHKFKKIFCIVALFSTWATEADIFKWQDSSGKTHYTDTPPPATPKKDVTDKLQDPGCGSECVENASNQKAYSEQYLKEKALEDEAKKMEIRQFDQKQKQSIDAEEKERLKYQADVHRQSAEEKARTPSKAIRQIR